VRPAYCRFPCAWGKLTGRCALAVEYLERDLLEAVDAIVDLSAQDEVAQQAIDKWWDKESKKSRSRRATALPAGLASADQLTAWMRERQAWVEDEQAARRFSLFPHVSRAQAEADVCAALRSSRSSWPR